MIVSELINFLKTLDQTATVEVLAHEDCSGLYNQGGITKRAKFDPSLHVEVTDLRQNAFAKGTAYENHFTILLGSSDIL